jgi:hypothetical protein
LLSLGASSLPGPPEDLSTVEELQGRLPFHLTTKVSVWPCAVAVCAVYRGGPLQTRRPQPHSFHTRCRLRFFDFPALTKSVSKLTGLSQENISLGKKSTFLFPFRLRRLQNCHRLRSLLDCPRRCPPLRRCRRLRCRVFWLPAPLLSLLLWTSCL